MTSLKYKSHLKIFIQTMPVIDRLLFRYPQGGGRSLHGKISHRRLGGGVKRFYRLIDFRRLLWNFPSYIFRIEYDPKRTAFIHLICYINGMLSYILATEGVNIFDKIYSSNKLYSLKPGNYFPLEFFPEGTFINCMELSPSTFGKIARAAGTAILLLKKFSSKRILLRYPSKEEVFMPNNCFATFGRLSNLNHKFMKFYKAGQKRNLGIKPIVRGVARNPIDHPHGGAGGRCLVTFWSQTAKNFPTRKKPISSYIVLSRKKKGKKAENNVTIIHV